QHAVQRVRQGTAGVFWIVPTCELPKTDFFSGLMEKFSPLWVVSGSARVRDLDTAQRSNFESGAGNRSRQAGRHNRAFEGDGSRERHRPERYRSIGQGNQHCPTESSSSFYDPRLSARSKGAGAETG